MIAYEAWSQFNNGAILLKTLNIEQPKMLMFNEPTVLFEYSKASNVIKIDGNQRVF